MIEVYVGVSCTINKKFYEEENYYLVDPQTAVLITSGNYGCYVDENDALDILQTLKEN